MTGDTAMSTGLRKKQAAVPLKEMKEDGSLVSKNREHETTLQHTTTKTEPAPGKPPKHHEHSELEPTEEDQPPPPTMKPASNPKPNPKPKLTPTDAQTLQAENLFLREKLKSLQSDLTEAQDTIFSLQPLQQTLTEPEAIDEFTALKCAVENWVDAHLAEALEEKQINDDVLGLEEAQNLLNLVPPPGKSAFAVPGTDVDNVHAAIWRYLVNVIFSQEFYCPLPRHEREFVTGVERGMRTLQPRRDTRQIRHWHMETYTAATTRPGFTEYAESRMWHLSLTISKSLLPFASEFSAPAELAKTFYESITKPAFALARKMHLCFDEYTLEWTAHHDRAMSDGYAVFERESEQRFEGYEFVSLTDRKILREHPNAKNSDPDAGPIKVRWLFDVAPKLVFRRLKADAFGEGKVLVKSRVLVRVYKPKKSPSGAGTGAGTGTGGKKEKEKEEGHKTVLGEVMGWVEREVYLLEKERERESEKERLRMAQRGRGVGNFMGLFG